MRIGSDIGNAFVRFRYHFGVEFSGQFPIAKGVSKMEPPFRVGVEQNGTPLPLPIPTHLFCPFLPEHGGKVGFDLLQLGGSGFLLPVLGCKSRFSRKSGLHFPLAAWKRRAASLSPVAENTAPPLHTASGLHETLPGIVPASWQFSARHGRAWFCGKR